MNLKEGEAFLKENISSQLKKNLKKDYTEKSLLEIREYSLRLDKFKNETINNIDDVFKNIINSLKERKNSIISDALERFSEEKENIIVEENKWFEKQEITETILSLMNDKNENGLLLNSKYILEGLRKISEPSDYKKLKIHNDINTSLTIIKEFKKQEIPIIISFEEVLTYLSKFVDINDPNILEYRS